MRGILTALRRLSSRLAARTKPTKLAENRYYSELLDKMESGDFQGAWLLQFGAAGDKRTMEAAFHKARYHWGRVSDAKRYESQRFLIFNRYSDMKGNVVKHGDPLPTGIR